MTVTAYHASRENRLAVRPALHVGTVTQARMRCAPYLHRVTFDPGSRMRRLRDHGGWNGQALRRMTKRCGCIVYLNRYEGVPIAAFERAWSDTKTLDELPDADFVRLVPEARDSWIIMDPDCIVGIEMVDRYDATLT